MADILKSRAIYYNKGVVKIIVVVATIVKLLAVLLFPWFTKVSEVYVLTIQAFKWIFPIATIVLLLFEECFPLYGDPGVSIAFEILQQRK